MGGGTVQVEKQHFVLVHGACHGAWCWYKLESLLKAAGHQVTSLDMAACGIDPRQIDQLYSYSDYFEPLTTFMETVKEKVVLVAHSFGGIGVSMSMESFPDKISVSVFVSAQMPSPNAPSLPAFRFESNNDLMGDEMDNEFHYDNGPDNPPTSFKLGPRFMSVNVYQQSPPKELTLATKLVRVTTLFNNGDQSRELVLSDEKYGSVNRVFVINGADKFAPLKQQLAIIEANPPDEVYEIQGADHMAMLSRSHELCVCLQDIVENFT